MVKPLRNQGNVCAKLSIKRVREMYENSPQLATRCKQMTEEICVRQSPTKLNDWLTRIEHQMWMTDLLDVTAQPGQLMIQQAFENMKKVAVCSHNTRVC